MAKTTQRRKIFPHIEDDKSSPSSGTEDGDGDPSYDNAKSSKSKKRSSAKGKGKGNKCGSSNGNSNGVAKPRAAAPAPSDHLLPLPLVVTVLLCSGLFWMSSFRDVMATGKPVLDTVGKLWGQEDADLNLLVGFLLIIAWVFVSKVWSFVKIEDRETSSETPWESLGGLLARDESSRH